MGKNALFDDSLCDFSDRLAGVGERIAAACARSGRSEDDVRLLAVTKGWGPEAVSAARAGGIDLFGESRVGEAAWKIDRCGTGGRWHMIGHLQRNKAATALSLFECFHSVDSLRLIETLDRLAEVGGYRPEIMLEVNVAGESSKFGFSPEEVPPAIEQVAACHNLTLCGLMTIPPFSPDPEDARPFFSRLRELRDEWSESTGFPLTELSMGMSGDFEVAVECGSTCVRLGTALFGSRPPSSFLRLRMQAEDMEGGG